MTALSTRRGFIGLAAGSWVAAAATRAAAAAPGGPGLLAQADGDALYAPRRGQSGKDVIWIPTPDPLVTRMLQLAAVKPTDVVVDLGSGDGKIVIAAARDFGARAKGIEFNPDMVALARRTADAAGVGNRVEFVHGDIFATDFTSATVVTMYLMPHLNLRLRHTILAMKPGTRVVSHEFRMGDWEPEETSRIGAQSMHLWIVPANAGGDWRLRVPQGRSPVDATMAIEQRFQKLRGNLSVRGIDTSLRDARVLGDRVHFAFTDQEGILREVDARIEPRRMVGTIADGNGQALPFDARRVGDAPPIQGSSPMTPTEIQGGS